jgi:antitoxin ParD1/3/4
MAIAHVSLPALMIDWVDQQIRAGRFVDGGDYIRDLIRKDQERCLEIAVTRKSADEGVKTSGPKAYDFDAYLPRMRVEQAAKKF